MKSPWLYILGIGDDGVSGLSPAATRLLNHADIIVGGDRHLEMLGGDERQQISWRAGISKVIEQIFALKDKKVCVLASGDPMCFGIGSLFCRRLPVTETIIIPQPSAFSLCCARLGWSLPEVDTLSLHGRPVALIQSFIQPERRLLILTKNAQTLDHIRETLRQRGYSHSRLWVLEHLQGKHERILEGTVENWHYTSLAEFNTIAVECMADKNARHLPLTPGLPDDAFRHDGQLTKRVVRAATIAALAPAPGQLLWDLGAGCGSVAIEWIRAARLTQAIAIERNESRSTLIHENAHALGTPYLDIRQQDINSNLQQLPQPDAIFIGGGTSTVNLVENCWQKLKPGGRLVANAVTLETEQRLMNWHGRYGGELVRMEISHAEKIGASTAWRPQMPVTQFAVTKSF